MSLSFSKTPSFINQSPDSDINKVCANIVVFPDEEHPYQSGSCCRIAKNIYLTAAHVVRDWNERFQESHKKDLMQIWVIHVEKGPKYSIWVVDRAWINPISDLVLLHTRPYNDTAIEDTVCHSVALNLAPPQIGERVVGFGHHSPSQNVIVDETGVRHIEINNLGAASVGEVRTIHQERRDAIRLNFPCFQVNARFDGGMSGGPVFSDNGHVCGVISSNLPPEDDNQEHISYASTLWPLMVTPIDIAPDGNVCTPYLFFELVRKQIVQAIGYERVRVMTNTATGAYQIEFR